MRSLLKFVVIVGVVAAVIILAVTSGWFGSKPAETKIQEPPPSTPTAPESTPITPGPTASKGSEKKRPSSDRRTNQTPTTTSANATNQVLDWEDRLDAIVGGEGEDAGKVKQLLEMFPRLPEDGQVEVAQHLSNLVADQDYAPLG